MKPWERFSSTGTQKQVDTPKPWERFTASTPDPFSKEALDAQLRGNVMDKVLVPLGRAATTIKENVQGLALDAGNAIGVVDQETVDDFDKRTKAEREFYSQTPIGSSVAGKAVEFGGELLFTAPLGGTILKGGSKVAGALTKSDKLKTATGVVGLGATEGALVSDTGDQLGGAALGAGFAYGGHRLFNAISSRLGKKVTAEQVDEAIGSITGRLGINADKLSDVQKARLAEIEITGGDTKAAEALANFEEFGVDATRGQITGNRKQLASESRIRAEGDENVLTRLDQKQQAQVQDAVNRTGGEISGVNVLNDADLSTELSGNIQQAHSASKKAMGDAFEEAEAFSGGFDNRAFSGLRDEVNESLGSALSADLASGSLPETARIINKLEGVFKGAGVSPVTRDGLTNKINDTLDQDFSTSLQAINSEIKAINAHRRSPTVKGSADEIGLNKLRTVLEGKIDNAIDQGLYSGDIKAVEAIRKARSLAKDYYSKFTSDGAKTVDGRSSRIIEKLVDDDATPERAMNYILGSSVASGQREALATVRKLKSMFPENGQGVSPELNALKAGAFNWILRSTNKGKEETISKRQLKDRVEAAFNGKSRGVIEELFSADEIAKMKRLTDVVIRQQPDKISGKAGENWFMKAVNRLSGVGGFTLGLIFLDTATAATASASLFATKKIVQNRVTKKALTDGTQKLREVTDPDKVD